LLRRFTAISWLGLSRPLAGSRVNAWSSISITRSGAVLSATTASKGLSWDKAAPRARPIRPSKASAVSLAERGIVLAVCSKNEEEVVSLSWREASRHGQLTAAGVDRQGCGQVTRLQIQYALLAAAVRRQVNCCRESGGQPKAGGETVANCDGCAELIWERSDVSGEIAGSSCCPATTGERASGHFAVAPPSTAIPGRRRGYG
jgi:hypothetical protein